MQAEENQEREWNTELNRALKESEQTEKRRQEALEAQVAEDIRQFERAEEARKERVAAHYRDLRWQMYLLHEFQCKALMQRHEDDEQASNCTSRRIEKEEKELAISMSVSQTNAREALENELRARRQRWADEFLQTMTRHNSTQSKLIGVFWEEVLRTYTTPATNITPPQEEESDDHVSEDDLPPTARSPASESPSQKIDLPPPATDPTHILDAAEQLQLHLKALTEAQNYEKTALRECLARDEEKLKTRIARSRPSQELLKKRDALTMEREEAEKEVEVREKRVCAEKMWFNLILRERGEMLKAEERRTLESGGEVR